MTSSMTTDLSKSEASPLLRHLQPVLLLSAYTLQFDSLVSQPVSTLSKNLLPLCVVQAVYLINCLPLAGTTRDAEQKREAKNGPRKKQSSGKSSEDLSKKIATAILSAILALVPGGPLLAVIMILFGAPLTSNLTETVLTAAHMGLLVIMPLMYTHELSRHRWKMIISMTLPLDEVFGASIGALVGSWLGAVPIPLDWDRPWQAWPITIVTGTYLGYISGKVLGGYVFKGRVIDLS